MRWFKHRCPNASCRTRLRIFRQPRWRQIKCSKCHAVFWVPPTARPEALVRTGSGGAAAFASD